VRASVKSGYARNSRRKRRSIHRAGYAAKSGLKYGFDSPLAVRKFFPIGSAWRGRFAIECGLRYILDSGVSPGTGHYEIHSATRSEAERPVHLWARILRTCAGGSLARLPARILAALRERMFLQELQAEESTVSRVETFASQSTARWVQHAAPLTFGRRISKSEAEAGGGAAGSGGGGAGEEAGEVEDVNAVGKIGSFHLKIERAIFFAIEFRTGCCSE